MLSSLHLCLSSGGIQADSPDVCRDPALGTSELPWQCCPSSPRLLPTLLLGGKLRPPPPPSPLYPQTPSASPPNEHDTRVKTMSSMQTWLLKKDACIFFPTTLLCISSFHLEFHCYVSFLGHIPCLLASDIPESTLYVSCPPSPCYCRVTSSKGPRIGNNFNSPTGRCLPQNIPTAWSQVRIQLVPHWARTRHPLCQFKEGSC